MLEHRVSTSSSIHNREHHAILGAKFSIARIHSNLLPRPDLIRRVEEASNTFALRRGRGRAPLPIRSANQHLDA